MTTSTGPGTATDAAAELVFPPDFWWGAATAAYQIEGAVAEDGADAVDLGHLLPASPGTVAGGDTGDVACDHYHRYREDVALMAELGPVGVPVLGVLAAGPAGRRAARSNPAGLDFYDRLVDELLGAGDRARGSRCTTGICRRRWRTRAAGRPRDTADRFAEYAALVAARSATGSRCWTTLNEPWCSAFLGYGVRRARARPARTRRRPAARRTTCCSRTAWPTRAMRGGAAGAAQVGITLNLGAVRPASDSAGRPRRGPAGRRPAQPAVPRPGAARRRYPADVLRGHGGDRATGRSSRTATSTIIATPIDVLGVNYYTPTRGRRRRRHRAPAAAPVDAWPGAQEVRASGRYPGRVTGDGLADRRRRADPSC